VVLEHGWNPSKTVSGEIGRLYFLQLKNLGKVAA
jgi:hypothetical protein